MNSHHRYNITTVFESVFLNLSFVAYTYFFHFQFVLKVFLSFYPFALYSSKILHMNCKHDFWDTIWQNQWKYSAPCQSYQESSLWHGGWPNCSSSASSCCSLVLQEVCDLCLPKKWIVFTAAAVGLTCYGWLRKSSKSFYRFDLKPQQNEIREICVKVSNFAIEEDLLSCSERLCEH